MEATTVEAAVQVADVHHHQAVHQVAHQAEAAAVVMAAEAVQDAHVVSNHKNERYNRSERRETDCRSGFFLFK